ncbi:MAG: zinc ribbon domain-containing protein [Peptococcaceae bacterium]|nr:zinc ribbon domain-containing protein [Peptococcaceae bacterium]
MPIYEFKCSQCYHIFEKLCRMGDDGKNIICPKCQASNPKRIVSNFASPGSDGGSGGGCTGCKATSCSGCH